MFNPSHPRRRRRGRSNRTNRITQRHIKNRARERYEVNLTLADIKEVNDQILSGKAQLHKKYLNSTRSVYIISLPNRDMEAFVIFDNRTKTIVTFLTEDMVI
jgi:hypothetical protein